ncbi:hypothetical protein HETIRDRAFT_408125 [Heterobasidion irregulare TC 32-1]|uniref:Uncharacterized protein n=1 Tax=Heterobasidion irregulare (strain TC 32-1) TaxID=747525 RepID=W4KFK1_HETIT|nr:uncharacterized protein HETIRDRAFT_408125 [Heterobasidion irregulare TC 32-1]ETW83811.1 hypothetical protein HETIRDRAFT_408125 [Heterobasidion irregulare TC 32-1]
MALQASNDGQLLFAGPERDERSARIGRDACDSATRGFGSQKGTRASIRSWLE